MWVAVADNRIIGSFQFDIQSFAIMTQYDYISFIESFVRAWKGYAEYIQKLTGLRPEDYEACKDVLKVLKSDSFRRLADEIMQGKKVSKKTIDEAEDLDRTLNRLKMILLPVDDSTKKRGEMFLNGCVSFYRLLIEIKLRDEGRLLE